MTELQNIAMRYIQILPQEQLENVVNYILKLNVVEKPKKSRHLAFGCLKGKISVLDDFNERSEDFEEYMR